MLDNINTSNVELHAAVTLIHMDYNIKDLPTSEGYFIRVANTLVSYQEIKGRMIFNIKMYSKFTLKSRFVAGGHMTESPSHILYLKFCFLKTNVAAGSRFDHCH